MVVSYLIFPCHLINLIQRFLPDNLCLELFYAEDLYYQEMTYYRELTL